MNEDNKHKCPLCGKDTALEEIFCNDCRELAQKEYLANESGNKEDDSTGDGIIKNTALKTDEAEQKEETQPEGQQPIAKKNKKAIYFFSIGVILLISVGAVSAYIIRNERKSKDEELAFWINTSDENTTLAYSKYLVRYPNGIFQKEAQNKILSLRHREDSTWQSISQTNNTNHLYTFLSDYPNTPYKEYVRNRIDSLTWINVSNENTAASYKMYLDNITISQYEGKYKQQAQNRYDYLSQLTEVDGADLQQVKNSLRSFFRLQTSKKYNDIAKVLVPELDNFYGEKDKSSKQIVDKIRDSINNNKISYLLYRTGIDSTTVFRDADSIYHTSFALTKEITYSTKGKKKEIKKDSITVVLNPQKLIKAIYRPQQ